MNRLENVHQVHHHRQRRLRIQLHLLNVRVRTDRPVYVRKNVQNDRRVKIDHDVKQNHRKSKGTTLNHWSEQVLGTNELFHFRHSKKKSHRKSRSKSRNREEPTNVEKDRKVSQVSTITANPTVNTANEVLDKVKSIEISIKMINCL